jgi:hypothetical protein
MEHKPMDFAAMNRDFYARYDSALHEDIFSAVANDRTPPRAKFLGEGRHFAAWRLDVGASSSLVVKVSNATFLEERGAMGLLRWRRMMERVRSAQIPLIPPFEIIGAEGRVSMTLPFGEAIGRSELNQSWLPLERHSAELVENLRRQRLVVDDTLQLKQWQGVPFLCDFSDLIELA